MLEQVACVTNISTVRAVVLQCVVIWYFSSAHACSMAQQLQHQPYQPFACEGHPQAYHCVECEAALVCSMP